VVKNLNVYVHKNFDVDKKLIHSLVKELSKELQFNIKGIQINFISSSEIMEINNKYLNHNYSTDIITFDYSESKKKLESEIYISYEDAFSNSKKYGVTFMDEIMRLVIHGFLHLLGYNDRSHKEKSVMKRLENKLLIKYRAVVNQVK